MEWTTNVMTFTICEIFTKYADGLDTNTTYVYRCSGFLRKKILMNCMSGVLFLKILPLKCLLMNRDS